MEQICGYSLRTTHDIGVLNQSFNNIFQDCNKSVDRLVKNCFNIQTISLRLSIMLFKF